MHVSGWRSWRLALAVIAVAGGLGGAKAAAAVTYVYNGKNYTYLYPGTGCLKPSIHLSMKIVLATPLGPNLSNQAVTAKSWVINDGSHLFKDTAATAIAPLQAKFSTNAAGAVTAWSVNSYYYAPDGMTVLYSTHSNTSGDYSYDNKCSPAAVGSNFTPGAW